MSIFAHARAVATSKPIMKCANCHHHEATIADLQAWVEDLRQSRDRWRDLALDAERAAADTTFARTQERPVHARVGDACAHGIR